MVHLTPASDLRSEESEFGMFNPNPANALRKQSRALFNAGKYAEALPICQHAVELTPDEADVWAELGFVLSQLRRYEEAIAAFDTAISLNERYTNAWHSKGAALLNLGRAREALDAFDVAHSLDPDAMWQGRILFSRNRLSALIRLYRYNEAVALADQILKITPRDAETWARRGNALAALYRFDEAEQSLLRAAELDSVTPYTLTDLANFYSTRLQAHALASEYAKRRLALRPNDAVSWQLEGFLQAQRGEFEVSTATYQRALKCEDAGEREIGDLWSNTAHNMIMQGRYGDALNALDISVTHMPIHPYRILNRGIIFSRMGRTEEALSLYEAAQKLDPDDLLTKADIAEAYVELGRLKEARAVLDEVFAVYEYHGCAWYASGLLETALGNYDVALTSFDRSIELKPTHAPHYVGLAKLLLKLEDAESACKVIERAVKLDPTDATLWRVKTDALRMAGRIHEADDAERHGAALLADQQAQVDAYLAAKEHGEHEPE